MIARGRSAVDDELIVGDGNSRVCGPFRGDEIVFEIELEPSRGGKVIDKGLIGDDKFV